MLEVPPLAPEGEFESVLSKVGSHVAGRYHPFSERIEDHYEVSDAVLGAGGNGEVLLARDKLDSAKTFAVKTIHFSEILGFDEWKMVEKQLEVALIVDHPHVIAVTDVYETTEALHFVMPCMEGGQLIKTEDAPPTSDHDTRALVKQMLLALTYLHSRGIVHRDIKPANFVYEKKGGGHVKMIDFDLSTFWKPGDAKLQRCCGSPGFMSPELSTGQGYTTQTDMWSLGVTLFTLLVGELPFSLEEEPPTQECVFKLLTSEVAAGLSPDAAHLLARLLRVDPAERLSAEVALLHPFVSDRERCPDVAQLRPCRSKRRNQGGVCRRQRRPQRVACAGSGSARKQCGSKMSTKMELEKLLMKFDDEQRLVTKPAVPLHRMAFATLPLPQEVAEVRWADLDDEVVAEPTVPLQQKVAIRWADLEDEVETEPAVPMQQHVVLGGDLEDQVVAKAAVPMQGKVRWVDLEEDEDADLLNKI